MRKSLGFILLFIWLLLLSTFLLNAHLFMSALLASFTKFYFISYALLPVLLLVTRNSFAEKAAMSFGIGMWLCALAVIFVFLQQAVSKIYGDIYQGSEVMGVYFTVFFIAWSFIVAAIFFAITLVQKLAVKNKGKI